MDPGIMKESEILQKQVQATLRALIEKMTAVEDEILYARRLTQQMEDTFAKQAEYLRGLSNATQGGGIRTTPGGEGDKPADSGGSPGVGGSEGREALRG